MKSFKIRYLIAVLLIAAAAVAVHLLRYESQYNDITAKNTISEIPLQIATWKGYDVKLDKKIYEILDTRAIIHRAYTSDVGDNVFLSIVYYADTKVDFHTPEGCLGAKGIAAEKKVRTITVSTIEETQHINVAEIITDDNGAQTLVYYFYKVGDFIGQDYIKMRMNVALNKLANGDASGALIRVSTPMNSASQENSAAILLSFLNTIFPAIEKSL